MRLEQRANMGPMKVPRKMLNRRSSSPSGLHLARICTTHDGSLEAGGIERDWTLMSAENSTEDSISALILRAGKDDCTPVRVLACDSLGSISARALGIAVCQTHRHWSPRESDL